MRNTATGKIMVVDWDVSGDPCGCSPTPKYVDATFDGLTNCCFTAIGKSAKTITDVNGTFRLTYSGKTGDFCDWEYTGVADCGRWQDENCVGAPDFTDERITRIRLRLDTTDSTISIYYWATQWGHENTPRCFFCATAEVSSGCVEPAGAVSNLLDTCNDSTICQDIVTNGSVAIDGTVAIVAV